MTAAILVSLFFFSSLAVAGVAAPSCDPSWNWASNSLGQNPCLVVAYMMSTCNGGTFTVLPLNAGQNYVGPTGQGSSNLCECTTIAYSLISACNGCQGAIWIPWSQFVANCTTTMPPSSFPNAVPDGTRVPQWALLDITQNLWDANQSYAVGDNPEIAPGTLLGPSGTRNSSSTGPTSTSSPSSTSAVTAKGKHSSNTGAIAGGVVGGIAAISVAIAMLFFCRRRRRAQAQPAPTVIDKRSSGFNSLMDQVPRSMSGPGTVTSSAPDTDPSMLRLYDPSDPTTYPNYQGPPQPPMYPHNSTHPPSGPYPSSGKGPHIVNPAPNSQGQRTRYTGLPEPGP